MELPLAQSAGSLEWALPSWDRFATAPWELLTDSPAPYSAISLRLEFADLVARSAGRSSVACCRGQRALKQRSGCCEQRCCLERGADSASSQSLDARRGQQARCAATFATYREAALGNRFFRAMRETN